MTDEITLLTRMYREFNARNVDALIGVMQADVKWPNGWEGGYGTGWFNDPNRNLVAIAMSQASDFLFNGGLAEFERLAAQA